MRSRTRALIVPVLLLAVAGMAAAQPEPSHPLSQIEPTDTELNMSNNAGATPYAIVGVPRIDPAGGALALGGDLDLGGSSVTGYFANNCGPGQAVGSINPDGSFTCVSVVSDVGDEWVNESGDTMSGILDMGGNRIENVGAADSSDDVMRRGNIYTTFVNQGGDYMSGNLDMRGNEILGVSRLRDPGADTLIRFADGGNDVVMEGGLRIPVGPDAY